MSEASDLSSERMRLRLDTDPRIVVTSADCEAISRGDDFTPTDLLLIEAGNHPYWVVASAG